jgi:hypothetical protein
LASFAFSLGRTIGLDEGRENAIAFSFVILYNAHITFTQKCTGKGSDSKP